MRPIETRPGHRRPSADAARLRNTRLRLHLSSRKGRPELTSLEDLLQPPEDDPPSADPPRS
jgi:hypothetical protein